MKVVVLCALSFSSHYYYVELNQSEKYLDYYLVIYTARISNIVLLKLVMLKNHVLDNKMKTDCKNYTKSYSYFKSIICSWL